MADWPAGSMPPGAITDIKALEGRIARSDISRGEPVLESKLAPAGTRGGLSAVVADGKRAMTVRVNDVVGVAGFALPGNYVDILVNTQDDRAKAAAGAEPAISKIVLERILVLAVAQESSRDDTKPQVVNAVTLELTPDQVEKLDLARASARCRWCCATRSIRRPPTRPAPPRNRCWDSSRWAGRRAARGCASASAAGAACSRTTGRERQSDHGHGHACPAILKISTG